MNYVAFEGISAMDNLYCETIRNMKVQEAIPGEGADEDQAELEKILTFKPGRKDFSFSKPLPGDFGDHDEDEDKYNDVTRYLVKHMWIIYIFIKFLYKGIYFYMFPYLIIPLSYYVYDYTDVLVDKAA